MTFIFTSFISHDVTQKQQNSKFKWVVHISGFTLIDNEFWIKYILFHKYIISDKFVSSCTTAN